MKNSEKIKHLEKNGYDVSYMSGNRNGELTIIGVVAKKNNIRIEEKNITRLFDRLK